MSQAYLLIGGNLGNRDAHLVKAKGLIEKECGKILQLSSIYETAAWGITEQPDFLNQVVLINTALTADLLLKQILEIEHEMGRFRTEKFGPRIIDIDILFYDKETIDKPHLHIPHPQIQNRRFALAPLAEIAPDFIHPVLKKNMEDLLKECPDKLTVKKYAPVVENKQ